MRGAETGRARRAKEAGWSCVGVLGSPSTPGDPRRTGLGQVCAGREPESSRLGPAACGSAASHGCCSRSTGLSRRGLRPPKAAHVAARGPPSAKPGPTFLSGSSFSSSLQPISGERVSIVHTSKPARSLRSSMASPQKLVRRDLGSHPGAPRMGPASGSLELAFGETSQAFCKLKTEGMSVPPTPHLPSLLGTGLVWRVRIGWSLGSNRHLLQISCFPVELTNNSKSSRGYGSQTHVLFICSPPPPLSGASPAD